MPTALTERARTAPRSAETTCAPTRRRAAPATRRATASSAIAATASFLAACSEDEALGTGPNGETPEPAINEVVVSPALNASSADTLVYFSFKTGGLVPRSGEWDLALRRFVDLDVIVKKHDVARARDLLLADNYDLSKPLTAEQQELLLRTQHNLQFTKDNRRLIVELHWEIAPHLFASTVQTETLWQNLVPFDLNGTMVRTLSADDLLFSLCVHGSRHLWERLGWICDVAELISRRTLNWTALLDRAAKADGERMFLLGLHLADKLLNAPLPSEVKRRCAADNRLEYFTCKPL